MRPSHEALAPYVASLVPYDVDLGAPGTHRGLPSTALTFVLPLDAPLTVSWTGRSGSTTTGWSSVSGLHTGPAQIHHDGHQRGIQLALTPLGSRALLGVPASALAGQLLSLDDVAPGLRHLPERLAETPWEAVPRRVMAALAAKVAGRGEPRVRAEVGRALAVLTRGSTVEQTAREVGYSRRRLTDLVRQECGVGPKDYQRIARFQRVQRQLGRHPLGEIAAREGYADQAHLTREWRAFAGCTPTDWLREEFPFVQDIGSADGAESMP